MPAFVDAAGLAELREGRPTFVTVDDVDLLLVRHGDAIVALGGRCTHAFADLATEGRVDGTVLVCGRHGARFDLATGRSLRGDCPNLPRYPVEVIGGRVRVAVGD